MPEMIVIKREWKQAQIKVGFDDGKVYVEAPIDTFADRFIEVLKQVLPISDLRWSVKEDTIKGHIEKSFRDAWDKVTMEMKDETKRIVR